MAAFLRASAPWDALVRNGNIELRPLEPGARVRLSPGIEVTPFSVVHRQEYSDTLGYLVHGRRANLMYVPDADTWSGWQVPFESILARADVALLDGSFYSADELGHRLQGDVPHPPVVDTVALLRVLPQRPPVWFVHLNHTNPLWDPESPLRRELPAGFGVATTGQRFAL
jgi:pyrroloquinoline quinone biosynthesis protein B